MSKILAIDYGLKRCGIAITDDARIIASPLTVVDEKELLSFLRTQVELNKVTEIVIGLPVNLKGEDTHSSKSVQDLFEKLKATFSQVKIELLDERFTSLLAQRAIHQMQLPKQKREQKGLIDKVSAAILLQNYLSRIQS